MDVSSRFSELKQQVDKAEVNVKASAEQDRAALGAKAAEARKAAEEHATQLRDKAQSGADQAEAQWNEVQSSWDAHVQRIRQRIADKRTEHDIRSAERDAEWAEAGALDAIDFAVAAIEEAEYAVLDAVLARMTADELAVAS